MSATCESVRAHLDEYLDDSMPPAEGRSFREHLGRCSACRDEVVTSEPSLLFAKAGPEDVSSEDVATVLAGVRAGVALMAAERKLGVVGRSRRRFGAMASAAALAAMVLVLPGSGRRPTEKLTVARPEAPAAPGFAPAGQIGPAGTFPADATIYDWNPGAGTEEPRVVWIVDRSLDI